MNKRQMIDRVTGWDCIEMRFPESYTLYGVHTHTKPLDLVRSGFIRRRDRKNLVRFAFEFQENARRTHIQQSLMAQALKPYKGYYDGQLPRMGLY